MAKNNWQAKQEALENISQGLKQQTEEKESESKKENVVASVNFDEHREMTNKEIDQHMMDLTKAVMELTERLDKTEGDAE